MTKKTATVVEEFKVSMIGDFLQQAGLRGFAGEKEYLVVFAAEGSKPEIIVVFAVEGDETVYSIRARGVAPLGRDMDDWVRLMNDWSRNYRWPHVYVDEENGVTYLHFEGHYQFRAGVHQALLNELSDLVLGGIPIFFDELAKLDKAREKAKAAAKRRGTAAKAPRAAARGGRK